MINSPKAYPSMVVGIEADLQSGGIGDSAAGSVGTFKSDIDYFGTVRGRIGYTADRTLYYVTAGFAYGGVANRAAC